MVEYSVALTSQPWTLPIDALVMSVGGGLGRLAWAVDAEYPAALRYSVRGGLLRRGPDASWDEFVADLQPQAGRSGVLGQLPSEWVTHWDRLHVSLMQLSVGLDLSDLTVYQHWAPHVRRFSYTIPPRAATVI